MTFEFEDSASKNAKMKVVGVGGAGGNAVDRMIDEDLQGVEFIAVNTDAQALKNSDAHLKIQIGKKLTRGLGAGARPEIGRQAIEENEDEVRRALDGADLVFVTAGMGGGTGTGAAPRIGEIARDQGALCVGIVSKPFHFEGKKRMRYAETGLKELRRRVDTMIVVPNERLLSVVGKGTSFRDALKKADEVLLHATQGISDLITVTGDINVDFADVRTVMSNRGVALMGRGGSTEEEDRAVDAAQQAISSPLLDNVSIQGATGVLVNITGGPDLTIDEVTAVNSIVQEAAGEEAEIIFGAVHDQAIQGAVRVTVIATGFDDQEEDEPRGGRDASRARAGSGGGGSRPGPFDDLPAGASSAPSSSSSGRNGGNGSGSSGGGSEDKVIRPDFRGEDDADRGGQGPSRSDGESDDRSAGSGRGRGGEGARSGDVEDLEIPTFIRRQMD
ncbi:MAG: cell division protein FtsZ [Candidatus Palauibacterales bacterium]|nr:cell division protein FtsZ [Candidatus Palauibacterales bacterium]